MRTSKKVAAFGLALLLAASPALADYAVKDGNGALTTILAFVCQSTKVCPAHVLINSSGTEIATSSNPVRTDPTGTTTQPVSAASLPLPTGAATAAKQPALGTAGTPSADVITVQGVTSMTPLKTDGSGATQPVSGTVTANQGGAPWSVGGNVASGASDSGNPVKFGGVFNSAQPTVTTAQRVDAQMTNRGAQIVATGVDAFAVGASQSGTWTLQPGNTANTTPWLFTINQGGNSATVSAGGALKTDASATTQPVSGTVTANVGTTNGLALDSSVNALSLAQGSTTSGQKGVLHLGAVTTAAPSYTTAQSSPFSLTLAGALRTDGSGTTQPVSGTVTANQGGAPWSSNWTQVNGAAVATGASGIAKFALTDGTGNAITSDVRGSERPLAVQIIDSAGNQVSAFSGSGGTSSNFAAAFPSAGTAFGIKNGANMVNATADGSNNLNVNCAVGCSGGTFNNNADGVATSSTNGQVAAWLYGWNGASFDRLQVDANKFLKVNVQAMPAPNATTTTLSAWNSSTTINTTQALYSSGSWAAVTVLLQETTTLTAGAITFEGSYDGTNWVTIPGGQIVDPSSATLASASNPYTVQASTNKPFVVFTSGYAQARVRLSTLITGSGTVTPVVTLWSTQALQHELDLLTTQGIGAPSDAVCGTSTGTCDLIQLVKFANQQLALVNTNLTAAIPVGSNVIGKVTTDQTTHGTTDLVAADLTKIAGSTVVADPCQVNARTYTPISVASAANTKIITGTSAKKTYLCHLYLFAAAANNVGIVEGTGTNCASSPAGVIGGATAAAGINLAANQGWVEGNGQAAIAATATNADDFCLITSTSAQLSGVAVWVQQ